MSDYDELIHALRYCADRNRPDCSVCEYEAYDDCDDKLKRDAAAAIEALEAANKELSEELLEAQAGKPHWISAELPPKENGAYVVWWNYKGASYWFRGIFFDGRWLFEHGTPKPDYWMPLPEPPQEVQDGPIITPCRGCSDYDGYGGCKSKGGCARAKQEVQE